MMHRWVVGLIMAMLLVACADPELERLDRELARLRSDVGEVNLSVLPELPAGEGITYDHADARDPFVTRRPDVDSPLVGSSEMTPDRSWTKEPLEAYGLETLELVGTLAMDGRYFALVRTPDGRVYRLTTGNRLGTDFGRIVDIDGDSVRLVEVIATGQGGWAERTRQLTMEGESDRRN